MKKTSAKKLAAAALAGALCISAAATPVIAAVKPGDGGEIVSPMNIAIVGTSNILKKVSGNKLSCYGSTDVQDGYKAGVVVELQQYDGGWTTIKTWADNAADFAEVDEEWSPETGYSYRLKLTHKAFNSNWSLVESFPKYSDTVKL